MGTTPVTYFPYCDYEFAADGSILVSSSGRIGVYPNRVTEKLEYWAAAAPNRVLFARRAESGWQKVRYSDALDAARRIGQALLDRGLGLDRPVLILSGNSIEHGLLALACLHVGVPFASLATAYSLLSGDFTRLRDIVALVRPGLVFADDASAYAAAIRACVPAETEVTVLRGDCDRVAVSFDELLSTCSTSAVDTAAAAIRPNTVAKLQFTSGSTGFPKGVITTQRVICGALQSMSVYCPVITEEPPILVDWMPWNHAVGGTVNFGITFYNGGTLYIDDGKPLPGAIETTVRNLREIPPTIHLSVPKAYEELVPWLHKDAILRKSFFSRVRLLQYTGAAISQDVCKAFDDLALDTIGRRIPWLGLYGSSEGAFMLADQHAQEAVPGSVGLPLPGVTLKLAPVDSRLEARVRGPCVTPGYWRRDDLTSAAFDDEGFFRTGDALEWIDPCDPETGLRYNGRIAEDFKLNTAIWVRVGMLREHLLKHLAPEIQDVVIVGENRHFVSVLAIPSTPDIQAIRDHVLCKLKTLAEKATGSSNRVSRLAFITRPLSIDAGELTVKGTISQRGILQRNADLVDDLYADNPPDHILCGFPEGGRVGRSV
jgi:feruloyl-CoA synthase